MKRVSAFIHNFLHHNAVDTYVPIAASGEIGKERMKLVPSEKSALDGIPNLGPDHEERVAQAKKLYHDTVMQRKWLCAIHFLRKTKNGWMVDPKRPVEPMHLHAIA